MALPPTAAPGCGTVARARIVLDPSALPARTALKVNAAVYDHAAAADDAAFVAGHVADAQAALDGARGPGRP